MTEGPVHRCGPPFNEGGASSQDVWFCPECGRGWELPSGGDWTPAGRSADEGRPAQATAGFMSLPPDIDRERAQARMAEGFEFADSLAGLDAEEGARLARERGFDPEVIPQSVEAVTADLRWNRIRLFVDDAHVVVQATWG